MLLISIPTGIPGIIRVNIGIGLVSTIGPTSVSPWVIGLQFTFLFVVISFVFRGLEGLGFSTQLVIISLQFGLIVNVKV